MMTLVIATRNAHKLGEIREMLPAGTACLGLEGLVGVPEVVEDATTFSGNALKKALSLSQWLATHRQSFDLRSSPCWVLADDSGLEVDHLNGAPGVHSARFASLGDPNRRGNASDAENNIKLLTLLAGVPEARRKARFRCALALVPVHGVPSGGEAVVGPILVDGTCEGRIASEPQGAGGFGYDPLFIPDGYSESFATLGVEIKNRISHRARALARLRQEIDRLGR